MSHDTRTARSHPAPPRPHHRVGARRALAWLDDALCAQVDPDLFFPDHRAVHVARAAKRICGRCPARDACRGYALTYPDLDGIWGGTTPRDRQRGRHA